MRKLLNYITYWKIFCNLIQYQIVTAALGVKIILISSCYPSSTVWITELVHLSLPLGYSLCYITFAFCIIHCRNISSPDLKPQVSPIFLRFGALWPLLRLNHQQPQITVTLSQAATSSHPDHCVSIPLPIPLLPGWTSGAWDNLTDAHLYIQVPVLATESSSYKLQGSRFGKHITLLHRQHS